jgi:hypothetical protein
LYSRSKKTCAIAVVAARCCRCRGVCTVLRVPPLLRLSIEPRGGAGHLLGRRAACGRRFYSRCLYSRCS